MMVLSRSARRPSSGRPLSRLRAAVVLGWIAFPACSSPQPPGPQLDAGGVAPRPSLDGAAPADVALLDAVSASGDGSADASDGPGIGDAGDASEEADAPPVTPVLKVATGGSSTCAILTDGTVRCWGLGYGLGYIATQRCGVSQLPCSLRPTEVPGLTQVTDLALGDGFACAVKLDGTVACWGANTYGQLGDGTTNDHVAPAPVPGLSTVTHVVAGQSHACALLQGASVECWGRNIEGELGDGTVTTRSTPGSVTGLGVATGIAAEDLATCARLANSTAQCWGYNERGELGNGNVASSPAPTAVSGLGNVLSVGGSGTTSGYGFGCAALADGTARCWGENSVGQLGSGATSYDELLPVAVAGLSNVAELEPGGAHGCARLTDGTARCWGANLAGQLGDGTTISRPTIAPVTGLTGAMQLAARGPMTCAVVTGGQLYCWGINDDGQLGDGTTVQRSTPVAVVW